MSYRINEVFYSVQGEGIRAGTANVFVRFSGCNLKCSRDDPESGFDCDTEFASGVDHQNAASITLAIALAFQAGSGVRPLLPGERVGVILTGGEPALQVDQKLIDGLKQAGFYVAIETNGTRQLPEGLDWISCSPKSAEHTLKLLRADELRYVRHAGQGIPKPVVPAQYHLLSPAFDADGSLPRANLEHCIRLVKENPTWRLSVQQHKSWKVR